MSCIVKSYNKRNDTYYVYESTSYWDASTKTPRNHRRLIGKIDKISGEVIPTGKRGRPRKTVNSEPAPAPSITGAQPGNVSSDIARLKAALEISEKRNASQEAQIKSLDGEVRRLSYQLKTLAPYLDSIEKSLGNVREIIKATELPL